MRGLLLVAGLVAGSASGQDVPAMLKGAKPVAEVATIKLTDPADQSQGFRIRGHRILLERETLTSMIMFAYQVHVKQVVDYPAWAADTSYDVDAIPDQPSEPDTEQMQGMLRQLLEERFGLKFHHEKREMTYFALSTVKGAAKLVPSKSAAGDGPDQTGNMDAKAVMMKYTNNTMDDLTLGLQYLCDKPVVNQTGLAGRYDFTLRWAPDTLKAAEPNDSPGLFTAMRDELGLKVDTVKGLVDVLVIDHVERPSSN